MAALRKSSGAYEDFLDRCVALSPFMRLNWVAEALAEWSQNGAVEDPLRFLVAKRAGAIVGILPLQLERKTWRRLGLRRLFFAGEVGGVFANHCPDLLVACDEARAAVVSAMLGYLREQNEVGWDLLSFNNLYASSPTIEILAQRREVCAIDGHEMTSILEPDGDGENRWTGHLAPKLISDLRRRRRKLEEAFECVEVVERERLDDADWAVIAKIHRERQQVLRERGFSRLSVFDEARRAQILRKVLEGLDTRSTPRFFFLNADGRCLAFSLGLWDCGVHYRLIMGMDSEMERYAPSKVLAFEILQRAAAWPITQINFLWGPNHFKREFCNRFVEHRAFEGWHPRLVSQVRRGFNRLVSWVERKGRSSERLPAGQGGNIVTPHAATNA